MSTSYAYTVDDCLKQIVQHVETMGVEDASHHFIRKCLVRLRDSAVGEHIQWQLDTGSPKRERGKSA